MDPTARSISVDRRRVVPGELRHFELRASGYGPDVIETVMGWFGRAPDKRRIEERSLTTSTWGIGTQGIAAPWNVIASLAYRRVDRADRNNEARWVSELDVEVEGAVWRGECDDEPLLDVLVELYPQLAAEARREVALGFGRAAPSEPPREGLFQELLRNAREWLASPQGMDETRVVTGEYRTQERKLRPAFSTELEIALVGAPTGADRGPFAAIVAAELGVKAMVDHLSTLTTSPHALMAAVASGAALRLGESPIRVGKPEHVEPYIDADTSRAIAAWATGA